MIDIEQANDRLDAFMLNGSGISKAASNNASMIGHPCPRFLFYRRHPDHYDQCSPFTLASLYRMWGGREIETSVVRLLLDAGFQVTETQKSVYYQDFQVAGRIDGKLGINGTKSLMEIKSLKPWVWDKITVGTDFLAFDDSKWFHRKHFDQLNWYLLAEEMESGLFVLVNVDNSRVKLAPMELDFDRADAISRKLILVNECLENNTPPDSINNPDICPNCAYFGHCRPPLDFSGGFTSAADLPEDLPEKLDRYRELKPLAGEYGKLDKELSKTLKGIKAIVGQFIIDGSWKQRRSFDVPDEVKAQYETDPVEYWTKKITWPQESEDE